LSITASYCRGCTDKIGFLLKRLLLVKFNILIYFLISIIFVKIKLNSVLAAVIFSLILNWQLTLIFFVFILISFLSETNSEVKIIAAFEEGRRIISETIGNIRSVISLTREKYFIDKFNNIFKQKSLKSH
jgi:ABC-type multidrug transport system fused ATPase/permease subunit